jgi:hypothetical protein
MQADGGWSVGGAVQGGVKNVVLVSSCTVMVGGRVGDVFTGDISFS